MTRKSLLLCTAVAFAAAHPQNALSEPLPNALQGATHLAQAAPPPADERHPGQHPGASGQQHPGEKAPPGKPAPGAPQHPEHPGGGMPPRMAPGAAQTAPGMQQHPGAPAASVPQHPGAPAAAQTAPEMQQRPGTPAATMPQHPGAPAAAQTAPGMQQHPGAPAATMPPHPGAPAAAQTAPGMQQHPGAPAAAMPQRPGAPAAAQTAPGMQPLHPAPAAAGMPARPPVAANVPLDPKAMPQRLDQVKAQRTETHEGNTTIIKESNRTIIQEGGQTIIRHDPSDRFRLNAKAVNVTTRGNVTVTAVVEPGGFQVVTETDVSGRLLRRIRRDTMGREVILIDNSFEPHAAGLAGFVLVDLRPPVVTIAPQLYIRDAAAATAADILLTLSAPPVVRIERRYSLDEILYNEPLRARMPRVDIDTVNFDTGSWEIAPDQADRLAFVAQGILAAVKKNPNEMFLVEGYTDAVGNDVDNLSLSDHRAESVAEMLASQFGVPAENLTTQGYGKQFLKVPTPGPERANRRVAVRRITPLLNGGQS